MKKGRNTGRGVDPLVRAASKAIAETVWGHVNLVSLLVRFARRYGAAEYRRALMGAAGIFKAEPGPFGTMPTDSYFSGTEVRRRILALMKGRKGGK